MTTSATSDPAQDLLQSFLHADYVVSLATRELTLRIGQCHPALDRAIAGRDWAVLTACNPGAARLDDSSNRKRQQQLIDTVERAGLDYLHACNRDPGGIWPEEPGLMILDADHEMVARLAGQFGQIGAVAGGYGQPAILWVFGDEWPARLPPCVRRGDR